MICTFNFVPYIIIIIIIIIIMLLLLSVVTALFSPVLLLLNQRRSPPLNLQISNCSIFRVMCYVPSIAVFCSESIECFPGVASTFFPKPFFTIPVAPIITGIVLHFRFHVLFIYAQKLL